MNHECTIVKELDLVHKWAHKCGEALSHEELETANKLGNKIVDFLNELNHSNGIKLLALYDALVCGAEHMEKTMPPEPDPDKPVTIQ